MAFNPEKCMVTRITKLEERKKPTRFDYKLHWITFQLTKYAKYLSILSDDLVWSKHINHVSAKGNKKMKFRKTHTHPNEHSQN